MAQSVLYCLGGIIMSGKFLWRFIVLLILSSSGAYALTIVGTPPTTPYERFSSFVPLGTTQTTNASFWAASSDLSAVGWQAVSGDWRRGTTLITPLHAVLANHFNPGVGAQFAFRATDGTFYTRTVTATNQVGITDALIITFDSALPATVNPMPIWVGMGTALGQNAYLYGQGAMLANSNIVDNISVYTIGGSTGFAGRFDQTSSPGSGVGQVGDSGSPALLQWAGSFALFGPHWAIGSYVNQFNQTVNFTLSTYLGAYINQINTIVGADGYSVTIVPEPGTGVIVFVCVVILFLMRGALILRKKQLTPR
jgi:hypothetical protein